jgi:hypothetical protein
MDPVTLTFRTWHAWASLSRAMVEFQLAMARQMMARGYLVPFAPALPPSVCGPVRHATPV